MAKDAVDGLLGELRAGGEVDSRGRFTLDRAQAREKMQKFQLADARRYVLELVQSAVLRGATAIDFDIDADDMRMTFDGQAFAADELDDVWGSMFADGDDRSLRGLRQLALGLNAALGMGPRRIVVRSGDSELRLVPGHADALTKLEQPIAGTTIHVIKRVKLSLLVGFFQNLGGVLAEEVYIKERCLHARVRVTLDGTLVSQGPTVAGLLAEQRFEAPEMRGAVIVHASDAKPAELRLIKDGVWIDSRALDECGHGLVAIVEGELLRKDASLAKIVADGGLEAVVEAVRSERWGALARLFDGPPGRWASFPRALMGRVRGEVLRFMKLRDIRALPDAAALARQITWIDARWLTRGGQPVRQWSLLDLADAVREGDNGARVLRIATAVFNELAADERVVPLVHEDERKPLSRVLGCRYEVINTELARENVRALARKEFLTRTATPRLPEHGRYAVRVDIAGPGVTGELGLTPEALAGVPRPADATWLVREGCLLAAKKMDWGFAGVDVAIAAMFTPSDDYQDAVRDEVVVTAGLAVLAAVGEALRLAEGYKGPMRRERAARAWLTLVLDEEARASLWEGLGVPRSLHPDEQRVRSALPSGEAIEGDAKYAWVMREPLLEDFDGERRSLEELARRLQRAGHLDALDRSQARVAGLGAEVLWLGRRERSLVEAMFGPTALRSWEEALAARLHEREFRAKPTERLEAASSRVRGPLRLQGLDPEAWSREIDEDGVQGVVAVAFKRDLVMDREALRTARLELRVEERTLVTRVMDLGVGPLVGAVGATGLTAAAGWDDVAGDEALRRVERVVARAAWGLLVELMRRQGAAESTQSRWVTRLVLHRLALEDGVKVEAQQPALLELKLRTLDGGALTLAGVMHVVTRDRRIAWVPGTTPVAALGEPPVLREDAAVIEALTGLLGAEALVGGSGRLAEHQQQRWLEGLPKAVTKLERSRVFTTAPLRGGQPPLVGEIGLSRRRGDGGVLLELCTQGRRVGVVSDALEVSCEAIIADPELPMTAEGNVDTRARRYGLYLKTCRAAAFGLVKELCQRYASLGADDRAAARAVLLGFAGKERERTDGRGGAREAAWEAVRRAPLLTDVWGRSRTLTEMEELARLGPIEVVRAELSAPSGSEGLRQTIVRVDAEAERYLEGVGAIRALDPQWPEIEARLRELAQAPKVRLEELRGATLLDRKATLAGGLQAHLWLPRRPDDAAEVVFARMGREVGRVQPVPGVGCGGLVTGEGLVVGEYGVRLDERQLPSLQKQVCLLVEQAARAVKAGKLGLGHDERERVTQWLIGLGPLLNRGLRDIGKPLKQASDALAELVSPAMRAAAARAAAEKQARKQAERADKKMERTKTERTKVEAQRTKTERTEVERADKKMERTKVEAQRAETERTEAERAETKTERTKVEAQRTKTERTEAERAETKTERTKVEAQRAETKTELTEAEGEAAEELAFTERSAERTKVEAQAFAASSAAEELAFTARSAAAAEELADGQDVDVDVVNELDEGEAAAIERELAPEIKLVAAVRAELEWARARHGSLLERLRLDRLAVGTCAGAGIAGFDGGLVLQQGHPLVARSLARLGAGQGVDAIDMMFLVSAVYTRMNAVAAEIDASDEQAFVARMAENLAVALA
ncbi:MAG: hypothetical protein JNL82_17915 [Myxococcales bacterium]|nr:hypothetical protein [Myxococcales bacterium]